MKKRTVITAGQDDITILRLLLASGLENEAVRFLSGGGWSGADSLARSVLIHGDTNVALVVDADTTETSQVEQRRRFLTDSLGAVAPSNTFRVFVLVPAIEALLFEKPEILEQLVGHAVSERDIVHGHFEPKKTLDALLGGRSIAQAIEQNAAQLSLSGLQELSPIRELQEFLANGHQ